MINLSQVIALITDADLAGLGVTVLADVPEMESAELKYKFEEILRAVAIPKINEIIAETNDLHSIKELAPLISQSDFDRWDGKYALPEGGMPLSDMAEAVQDKINGATPTIVNTVLTGTVTPTDNTLYVCEISSALTISASSADVCPLFSAEFLLTIAEGGSISFDSAVTVSGDDGYTEPTVGEVWEINVLRGNVVIKRIKEAPAI